MLKLPQHDLQFVHDSQFLYILNENDNLFHSLLECYTSIVGKNLSQSVVSAQQRHSKSTKVISHLD